MDMVIKNINITFFRSVISKERIMRTKQRKIKAGRKLAEITAALVPCFTVPS